MAFAVSAIARAEVYTHKHRPEISELALSDGRTLKDAKILSDTAYTVTVASEGKIQPVDKKLLPAKLLAEWPIDEARGEKERSAERAKVQARADKLASDADKNAKIAEAMKAEEAQKNAAYAAKTEAEWKASEAKFYSGIDALARSRNGALIEGVASSYGNLYVLVRNVTDGSVDFDWPALRVTPLIYKGEHQLAGQIVMRGQTENVTIPAKSARVFRLKLTSQMESKSLRWVDRPEVYPVKQLYRQRNSWDMRDEYQVERNGPPPNDDEVTNALLRATRPFVVAPLRK